MIKIKLLFAILLIITANNAIIGSKFIDKIKENIASQNSNTTSANTTSPANSSATSKPTTNTNSNVTPTAAPNTTSSGDKIGSKLIGFFQKLNQTNNATINQNPDADVYHAIFQIALENQENKKVDFYGTFIPNEVNCSYSKCFYGWIDNYTILGQDTVLGFTNETLVIKPVFQFKTNSQIDYKIIKNPNLDKQWSQFIDVLCQKINPTIIQTPQGTARTLAQDQTINQKSLSLAQDVSKSSALPKTSSTQKSNGSSLPVYNFQTIQASDLKSSSQTQGFAAYGSDTLKLAVGDKLAKSEQNIELQKLKTQTSYLKQTLVLNPQNLVKSRTINYQIKFAPTKSLDSNGETIPNFSGLLTLNFGLAQRIKTTSQNVQNVKTFLTTGVNKTLTEEIKPQDAKLKPRQVFTQDTTVITDTTPEIVPENTGSPHEQGQVWQFSNQRHSGINVVQKFKQAKSNIIKTVDNQKSSGINVVDLFKNWNKRNLEQMTSNETIYHYQKIIVDEVIFESTYQIGVSVNCYLLRYPSDHFIRCIGIVNYYLFEQSKSVTVFNFQKSVSYSWSWSNQYSDDWDFSFLVPLTQNYAFIVLQFEFKVHYVINVSVNTVAGPQLNPYQVKVNVLATSVATTDSSARLRVLVVQAGAYVRGTIIDAATDPTFTLSYYFDQNYINLLARSTYWLNPYSYEWGFYFRRMKLNGKWANPTHLKLWTVKAVYRQYTIVDKSWNLYL